MKSKLPLKKSGTIAVIGPLADAKENMAGTWSVATNMDKSISLIAGIKKWRGMGLMCFTPGSNLDYDASLRKKATMFGKTLHRDRTAAELVAEALKIANQSDVIVAQNQQK
jgi:beta-glucosidase